MPDDRRFSDGDLERDLRDLEGRIEYPPTPDVARTVRLRLDREGDRAGRRSWRPPSFLAPRWAAAAAALALVCIIVLSPALRTTLSSFFLPVNTATQEADQSAAGPEGDRSEVPKLQEAGEASQSTGASSGATGCPYPAIEVRPTRAEAGAKLRLDGHNFSSGCEGPAGQRIRPARGVTISFRQNGEIWKLATLDAGRDLTFEARLRVPEDARPGPASLRASTRSGETVESGFEVLP